MEVDGTIKQLCGLRETCRLYAEDEKMSIEVRTLWKEDIKALNVALALLQTERIKKMYLESARKGVGIWK